MTARILPVSTPDEEQTRLLTKTLPGPDGQPLNIFRTLAHRPELMKRVNALGGYFFRFGSIPTRERELVILRVASRIGSQYELGQHRWIAAQSGLTADEIDNAVTVSATTPFDAHDRLLLTIADELVATDSLTAATWDASVAEFGDVASMELLVLVGFYRLLGGVLNGLGVELDPCVAEVIAQ